MATRLLTHTQVLSDDTAILTGVLWIPVVIGYVTAEDYAGGILAGLADTARAAAIGNRARELAETKYSYAAYLDKTRQACDALFPAPPAGDVVKDVA